MKTTRYALGLMFVAGIWVSSCNDENDDLNTEILSEEVTVAADLTVDEAQYEDLDDLANVAFEFGPGNSAGRTTEETDDDRIDAVCAVKTWTDSTLTIDYGKEGCTLPDGQVRTGKIHITWTGRRWEAGSVITWEAEDLSINDNLIIGKRTLTNLNDSNEEAPHHNIELTGGQIKFSDGTTATREVDRERVWYRGNNPLRDEVHILEGSMATGKTRSDVNYSTIVLEDMVYLRDCRVNGRRRFIPVQGVKQVTKEGEVFTINFGDGTCDTLVTITDNEGNEREVDLLDL
ncbi:MAG: hypothetical protein NXI20_20375 [bacterium]|nr:hypothetical protein [bacterium]